MMEASWVWKARRLDIVLLLLTVALTFKTTFSSTVKNNELELCSQLQMKKPGLFNSMRLK